MKAEGRRENSSSVALPREYKRSRRRHFCLLPSAFCLLIILAACRKEEPKPAAGGMPGMNMGKAAASAENMGPKLPPGSINVSADRQQFLGVTYTTVAQQPLVRQIKTIGRVEYDERRLGFVNTKFAGWIENLYVNFTGVYVSKGQPLMSIYSPDLVSAQEEYLQAIEAVRAIPGGADPSIIARTRDMVAAARRRLQLWDIEDGHIRQLEKTGTPRRTLDIHSPISGYVVEKEALQGLRVQPGMNLYKIADISRVWIDADIYEYEVPLIKLGQTAAVRLAYAPGVVFTGRVSYIYPYLDEMTRTVKVRLEFDNPDNSLKPGMYTDVVFDSTLGTMLVVPETAVLDTGSRKLVFVSRGEGRFDPRDIKTGYQGGGFYQVLGGLREGEKVVTSANFLIDSESQLSTATSKMKH